MYVCVWGGGAHGMNNSDDGDGDEGQDCRTEISVASLEPAIAKSCRTKEKPTRGSKNLAKFTKLQRLQTNTISL